jgi:hypothetical protein
MGGVVDRETTQHAARRAPRRKLFQPAELRQGTTVQRVHLLDLSTAGGLIHLTTPPAAGTIVMLACGPLSRSARVAWAGERRIGIAFVLPLSEAEVAAVATGSAKPVGR